MPWIHRGSSRVDEETMSHSYECSACGTEIDVEFHRHADGEHDRQACERARELAAVRGVMES
jgi:DNA-directed RNA polymerase subunit RPC12/RpoP